MRKFAFKEAFRYNRGLNQSEFDISLSIKSEKIKKHPKIFSRLFGVSPEEFDQIVIKVIPLWQKKVLGQYKRPGRFFKLGLEEMILMLLLYYRSYMSLMSVGFMFGIDESRVCRNIKTLEPLLAKVMALCKTKHLSKEDVENLIIDATEQPIEKPKRGQKAYYSGKKKRHTLKTEIRVALKNGKKPRIVHVSKTNPGSVHDLTVYRTEPPISREIRAYADSGYQGLDKIHEATEIPYKKSKHHVLDEEEKEYNSALSRIRIKIEHIIGDLKIFRILSDRYRNRRKRYHVKFNIIAGIVNFKNGFALA